MCAPMYLKQKRDKAIYSYCGVRCLLQQLNHRNEIFILIEPLHTFKYLVPPYPIKGFLCIHRNKEP